MKRSQSMSALAFLVASPLMAQDAKVTQLMLKDLPECPGKEGLMYHGGISARRLGSYSSAQRTWVYLR